MRFSQFLMEHGANDQEGIGWLLAGVKRCQRHLALIAGGKQLPAWRGDDHMNAKVVELPGDLALNYGIKTKRTERRSSLAQSNVALAYASREWKDLPRRSYSYFATFNRDFADANFGDLHWIVPFDDVTQFASAKQDFNIWGKDKSKRDVHQVLQVLEQVAKDLCNPQGRGDLAGPVFAHIAQLALPFADSFDLSNESRGLKSALQHPVRQVKALEFFEKLFAATPKIVELTDRLMKMQASNAAKGKVSKSPNDHWVITQNIVAGERINQLKQELDAAGAANLTSYLRERLSPEAFGVKLVTGYENLPKLRRGEGEFWFEGGFISFDAFYPNFIEESTAQEIAGKLLELLKDNTK